MKNRVLLVDDNPSNLIVFEEIISRLNLDSVKAKSASEAFDALQKNDISLILLDVQIPEFDGFDILKKIRKNKKWVNIPVIMISAVYKANKFQIKGIELGALDFIVKPIIPELLAGKIKTFIELFEYRKQQEDKLKDLTSKLEMTEMIRNENQILIAANAIFQNINKFNTEWETHKFMLNILLRTSKGTLGFMCELKSNGDLESQAFIEQDNDCDNKSQFTKNDIKRDLQSREIWKTAIKEKKSIIDNNPEVGSLPLTSIMAVPLIKDKKVYGLIGIANNPDGFDDKDNDNIEILSSIVTEANSRKKVELELKTYKNSLEQMVEQRTHQLEVNNEKLKLEQKERKAAEDIINSSPIVAFRWKSLQKGVVEYVSDNVEEISGYSVDELVNGNVSLNEIVHPEDIKRVYNELIGFIKDGKKNNHTHSPYRIIKKNGDIIWVDERIFFDRRPDGYVTDFEGIILDITDKIEAQNELIIAKEKAEESDKLKTAFLANMSHEIRTPMNAILGFSQLLSLPEVEEDDFKSYINTITNAGIQLMRLIDDIISISRIEAGILKMENESTTAEKVLFSVFKLFTLDAEIKNIDFSYNNQLPKDYHTILTDSGRLQQVLINLISNSFKFTAEGSIEYGCKLVGDTIEFFVRDTGIGIKKDDQNIIFERFRKLDHGNDVIYGGTGIGLSISKAFVERLGGKIWVVTDYKKGAELRFTIPATKSKLAEKHNNPPQLNMPDYTGKTFLIAEDETDNFQLLNIFITRTGARILWAKNGEEAVKIFRDNDNIDMILMDIKMPVMNGLEATKQIRKVNKDIPIIAQTAYAQLGDKELTLEAGCNNYISKPIQRKTLFELISKYI